VLLQPPPRPSHPSDEFFLVIDNISALTSSDFLNLLVSELQNQNPLEPTNSTDFINQRHPMRTLISSRRSIQI